MKKLGSLTWPLMWFMALLLSAFVAGCGSEEAGTAIVVPAAPKAITAYSLAGATGTINETAKTIAVTVPFGTSKTALAATFTSTGASVKVGATVQVSGTTANDFSSPVVYTVTDTNGATASYTVTVTVALASAKAITAYSLAGVAGTINEGAKTIAVTVPSGTVVSSLAATFTTTGASVKVAGVTQVSGTTLNNFTTPKAYLVTAADSTTVTYTVTVTVSTGPMVVDLGAAGTFVILAESAITDVPTSAIIGDVGLSPATGAGIGLTCAEVTGAIYDVDATGPLPCVVANTAVLTPAVAAKLAAYNDAAGRTVTSAATLDVGAGTLSGQTLAPGVYEWGTAVTITNDITLSGNATDVWIFKVAGTLDLASAKSILLGGTAVAKNIFWQVSGAVTVGTTAHMEGVVMSAGAITLLTGASANSRLLSATAVNLDSNAVTQPAP